ncbi:MAG: polymorphic toxin-type HINT domain-containing protein [Planctomycetota bacterium]
MRRSHWWFSLTFVSLFCSSPIASIRSAEPNELSRTVKVLEAESAGKSVNRRSTITNAGQVPIKDPPSAWQAGMVRGSQDWQPIEELKTEAKFANYYQKRVELRDKPGGQLFLARWCAKNELPQRATAHYSSVLAANPNQLEARKFLDHVRIGDQWLERQAALDIQKESKQILADLEQWVPKLKRIASDIQSKNAKVNLRGLKKLEDIQDKSAIPALELFASDLDDEIANICVKKIAKFNSYPACTALMRIAIQRPISEARDRAIAALKRFPEQMVVPELLKGLVTEKQVRTQLTVRPDGRLALSSLIGQELRDKKTVRRVDKLVNIISIFRSSATLENASVLNFKDSKYFSIRRGHELTPVEDFYGKSSSKEEAHIGAVYVPQDVATAAAYKLKQNADQQSRWAESHNQAVASHNQKICDVLRRITLEDHANEPLVWWDWWNESYRREESSKPIHFSRSGSRSNLALNSRNYSSDTWKRQELTVFGAYRQWSCLIAGTPIQTESGLKAVEEIQVGDLVASKDVETGELALKPVLLTTIRPPEETFIIAVDGEEIRATGGHLWWISGQGWVKTDELKAGQLLHTATGTCEIKVVTKAAPVVTHNLVVDDFNTYFVGEQRILSYDNTIVKATLKTVPGYEPKP